MLEYAVWNAAKVWSLRGSEVGTPICIQKCLSNGPDVFLFFSFFIFNAQQWIMFKKYQKT